MPEVNLLDIIGNLIFNWPNVIQPFLFKRGYVVWVFVLEKLALCERTPPPLILTSAPLTLICSSRLNTRINQRAIRNCRIYVQ